MGNLWYEEENGWILNPDQSSPTAQNFKTGCRMDLHPSIVKSILAVNDGSPVTEKLLHLDTLSSNGFSELLSLARKGNFRKNKNCRQFLNITDPHRIWVEVQGECNERCIHCYADSSPQIQDQLSLSTVTEIIDSANKMNAERIQFTGGDPLLWPDLPEVVHYCKKNSIQPEIFTNGIKLSDELYRKLAGAGPHFSFSFYSHKPEVHDTITQREGSWKRTISAIERALEGPTSVSAALVIMDQNKSHIQQTREFLIDKGIPEENVNWDSVSEVGRGKEHDFISNGSGDANSNHGDPNGSKFNPGKLCISYKGNVLPCIFQRWIRIGEITNRSLDQIIRKPALKKVNGETNQGSIEREALSCNDCQFHYALLKNLIK